MNEAMNLNTLQPATPIEGVTANDGEQVSTPVVSNTFVNTSTPVIETNISTPSETPQTPDIFSTPVASNTSILEGAKSQTDEANIGLVPLSATTQVNSTPVNQLETITQSVPNPQPLPTIATPIPIDDQESMAPMPVQTNGALVNVVPQPTVPEQNIVTEPIPTPVTQALETSPIEVSTQPLSAIAPIIPTSTVMSQTTPTTEMPTAVGTPVSVQPMEQLEQNVAQPSAIPAPTQPEAINARTTQTINQPTNVFQSTPGVQPIDQPLVTTEDDSTDSATGSNSHYAKNDSLFSNIDFGPLEKYLDDDNITDISYSNGGQLWLKTLDKGIYREPNSGVNDALVEKIAFQCSNVMGKTFNMAQPFLDSESAELRMNFVHDSIAKNGIAAVFRKTPAKIRLEKEKIIAEKYVTADIHDFLIKCVRGHCNIIVSGETGSGKTELVKYLASHTAENEKIITIEDTLELHLDRIFPERDIVAMKTNNIASYSDVLVTCMRQNPKWILLSEVRSAEAVTAVRNSISSGHNILSTIHSDKAINIPHRLYSLLESNIDVDQFLKTIYRYIQLGVFVRGRYDANEKRFVREIAEVTEFYVDDDNCIGANTIYRKTITGAETYKPVSKYLKAYLEGQGVDITNLLGRDDIELENDSNDNHMDNYNNDEEIETI